MKNLIYFAFLSFFLYSCGNNHLDDDTFVSPQLDDTPLTARTSNPTAEDYADLLVNDDEYIALLDKVLNGKEISSQAKSQSALEYFEDTEKFPRLNNNTADFNTFMKGIELATQSLNIRFVPFEKPHEDNGLPCPEGQQQYYGMNSHRTIILNFDTPRDCDSFIPSYTMTNDLPNGSCCVLQSCYGAECQKEAFKELDDFLFSAGFGQTRRAVFGFLTAIVVGSIISTEGVAILPIAATAAVIAAVDYLWGGFEEAEAFGVAIGTWLAKDRACIEQYKENVANRCPCECNISPECSEVYDSRWGFGGDTITGSFIINC